MNSKTQTNATMKQKRYLLAGATGSGKSSLLNSMFGLQLPTGMGGCTEATERAPVLCTKNEIYDSPGLPSQSVFMSNEESSFDLNYDKIFIIFEDSLKSINKFVRFAHQCEKEIIFIRSKCDNFGKEQFRNLKEEIEVDRSLLQSWGVQNPKLFATSASQASSSFDNQSVKRLLVD